MMDHGESIYNIIPPKEILMEKPPMYQSKFPPTIHPTGSTFGQAGTTHPLVTNLAGDAPNKVVPDKAARSMGRVPGSLKNMPDDFTKKSAKAEKVKTLQEVKRENPELLQPSKLKTKLKPGIPPKDDTPVMNLVTSKNFVVANAVETILAAPKKVSQGAKDYLNKEDYGKVPKYLQHIKKDIDAEYEYIRALQEQQEEMSRSQMRPLDDDERVKLIEGLKARWEQVNVQYQSTTHLTKLDTIGKIKRKEKYEAELMQIEKDIEKLSKKTIAVNMMA
mmetsp:Transcript_46275/g.110106  ORF Transcript_46275/g.110106 Transcript_46275/m.110106 type:complete len:276 (-) Transcript_46275:100-927(-)|eukprot:CAMPEP_0178422824 /NCGR_PEP_ID=MMETSP0689_2-20121128/27374_1 /TAXON_ID=160604 /ORGANISM="Amphidinium massartii, Strain CS-259" /LENGTH=275 /DNA_ID=CAMNT_0020044403 /DNA_START=88 /DNA_END=915 /DNA_ORIENTATION=+